MKLFYAPLQKMLKLSEKITYFFLLFYLNAFCVRVQKHSSDACLGWGDRDEDTKYVCLCLDGNSFELKY